MTDRERISELERDIVMFRDGANHRIADVKSASRAALTEAVRYNKLALEALSLLDGFYADCAVERIGDAVRNMEKQIAALT